MTDVDEYERTWAWNVRVGPLQLQLRHGVDECADGSRTWLTVRGFAPVLVAYLPVARFALHRLAHD